MRGHHLLDKLELVDPAYVEAADQIPRRNHTWYKWAVLAACLGLLSAWVLIPAQPEPFEPVSLQTITIPELYYGAMGFEGYLCYDIEELDNGNPWFEEMELATLPVYRNNAYDPTGAGIPRGLSETQMQERLTFAASALGLEVLSTEVMTAGELSPAPTQLRAMTDNGTLYIQANGAIVYFLPEGGQPLPAGYRLAHSGTTRAQAEKTICYLAESHQSLLRFDAPKAVSPGDYTFTGVFTRSYCVYDAAGDDLSDILNYHFRSARFGANDSGNLSSFRLEDGLLLAEKLGDYPVISVEEATELLAGGSYQTSVPTAFPGRQYIGKVELAYRTGAREEVLLPYYRFYVQLPDEVSALGLKTYGIYYVPAIAQEYIAAMPTYDGSFN